jgi:hypothetical protein
MNSPEGNPYTVSRNNWIEFSHDYEWAFDNQGERLVQKIKELKR